MQEVPNDILTRMRSPSIRCYDEERALLAPHFPWLHCYATTAAFR